MLHGHFLVLLLCLPCFDRSRAEEKSESSSPGELSIERLISTECAEPSALGDTLHLHYTGKLLDGRVIDTSLSRDPLVIELGKKQVIPGLEQSLLGVCAGEKRKVTIPPHLAYGKRGFPPTVPGDAVLEFETEVVALFKATYGQKIMNDILPLLCIALVPTLFALIGYYLYAKANSSKVSKKKLKEEKKNKQKKK
ncbi:peptidyl-prolyl cis-trans isomerase FKBP11 [Protopterus annectens]|uniref:peptidyl-prolyl cis-trans isomerase FKBP11 n=1 Tax=Protopterus annectens TaxID=7888 RepID=UPI001CFB2F02|nr:peptidyl-prolyl cis-trans isomerase FKBP11 [Protopterus annectens]